MRAIFLHVDAADIQAAFGERKRHRAAVGGIGVFAIPEMGRFYRHVLVEKNYPHHGAVAFGHFGKTLYEVFKYIGVEMDEINFNQPKGMMYPTENPFA